MEGSQSNKDKPLEVGKDEHQVTGGDVFISPATHPLVIGDKGDPLPSWDQISTVVSILSEAGICCCFIREFALNYYGARRGTTDRVLCVPDEDYKRATELFKSQNDMLKPCGPLPLRRPDSLDHKYPRFKAIGRTDFWLLLPASYGHIVCEPDNIEWSHRNLPYPKRPVYVQALLDTNNYADLEDLVDGMDIMEEWGEQKLDFDGYTDTKWLQGNINALQEEGQDDMLIFIDPDPVLGARCGIDMSEISRDVWDGNTHLRYMRQI